MAADETRDKRNGFADFAEWGNGDPSDASSTELVSALVEMFPELDPHEVLALFKRITKDQRLGLQLLYH